MSSKFTSPTLTNYLLFLSTPQQHILLSFSMKMGIFHSHKFILLLTLFYLPSGMPFTVIMSESGIPSDLVDDPQTGFSMNNDRARTDPHEQEALYEIMKATGNEWACDIPDVCNGRWHGIECMRDKSNVYHIVSLSFGALSDDAAYPVCEPNRSIISPSITKLPHLRNLFLYRCLINNPQPIPAFLGQLGSTLQTLVLRENGHVGPIPNELRNLTHLRILDLHKNNLNGSIPVSLDRITSLRSLDLSSNQLTHSIPNLTLLSLNILNLNQNLLSGYIPSALGNCHSLIKIDLSRNRLSGPIPNSLNHLSNLNLMDISHNSLSGQLPSFKSMNSLQALILNGNPMMYSTIPDTGFVGLEHLMILILSDMNLYGPIPESLGHLPNLHVLCLDGNQLNGSIPASFRNLSNLGELRLNNNQLTGRIPLEREMAWRMKRKLRLHSNSGLCYDESNGSPNDLGLLFHSGIGHCGTQKLDLTSTVQHLAQNNQDIPKINNNKSASVYGSSLPSSLLQLSTIFLCCIFTFF